MKNQQIEKSIRCSCIGGEHYLHFHVFKGDEPQEVYIDLNGKERYPFLRRIQKAWEIILGKEPCYDGIILDQDKRHELVDFLNSIKDLK